MRRRISSALGGSNSKEMILSVTLGAYMAATCSASRSVASLILEGYPSPEASLVMPIAFPRLACAVRPECAPRGSPAHPPSGRNIGNSIDRPSENPLKAKLVIPDHEGVARDVPLRLSPCRGADA